MPARLSRAAYADMFGPTVGDKVRLADTELIIEVEKDFTTYGEEVKFGGGKVIRDGMGQSQVSPRRRRRRHRHHQRADRRPLPASSRPISASRTGASRRSARPAIPTRSPASTSSSAPAPRRSPARARSSPPAASTRISTSSARSRSRRRSIRASPPCSAAAPGPATGTNATTCTPGAWHHRAHDRGRRRLPDEPRPSPARATPRCRRRWSSRCSAGACVAEAARGLGHDAGGDRLLPLRRRRLRRAGDDPHRHAERIRLRRGHDRRLQGPHHPRLPHRRRRRRPCARHHQGVRAAERHPLLDQSDAALHEEHASTSISTC